MRQTRSDPSVTLLIGFARAIPAIALAGLFIWMTVFVRGNGGHEIHWFGPAFFAVLAGGSAVWTILRAWGKSRGPGPKRDAVIEPEGDPSFDPDAAIRRYLADKSPDAPVSESAASMPPAPRPTFGRKRA